MADYYTLTQLALKLAISEAQIGELELEGFLHPILKDGRRFFSSSQAHDTQVALRLARKTENHFGTSVRACGGPPGLPNWKYKEIDYGS